MKLAKQFGYKLIIVLCIIATFCSFIASAPVYASKVNKEEFYYSGVQKGSYTIGKSFAEKLIETLEAILDYLLGICTMAIRMVFVGWTAIFERCLTLILKGASGEKIEVDGASATNIFSADGWVTLDAIFFNHVPLLDINFFNFEPIEGYDAIGHKVEDEAEPVETEEHHAPRVVYVDENGEEIVGSVQTKVVQGEKTNFKAGETEGEKKSLVLILKQAIASWYYVLRTISIMVMLVLLMYIGIQLAIKSSASDKAVYKQMLTDWVVGMILVFSIHYIMLFVVTFNETLVGAFEKLRTGTGDHHMEVYEYGLEERAKKPLTNEELELTLYDEVKTRAYDVKLTVGFTGMIMYMVLVYYAWKYTFIYLKRYLSVALLTIMAPLVAVSYAYNKVTSGGKATIFKNWLKEYSFLVILQSIHALIYLVFVQSALTISLSSISGFILVMVLLNFMPKAEGIFRKIFGITGKGIGGVDDVTAGAGLKDTVKGLKNTMVGMAGAKFAMAYTKSVAKIATKPLRAGGSAAFNLGMRRRARRLDEKAEAYKNDTGNKNIHNYNDYKKVLRKQRIRNLTLGEKIEDIEKHRVDVDKLEAFVSSLHEGDILTDEEGNVIGVADKAYIAEQTQALEDYKYVQSMETDIKIDTLKAYDKLHNKKGKLKRVRIFLGDKWQDIMDPTQYTERQKDGTYKTIETKREISKHLGKKIDGASYKLAKNLKLSNILGMSKEEKAAIDAQLKLISKELYGFAGILVGLPLLVAEPKAGMIAMSAGIEGASAILSGAGIAKKREKAKTYKKGEKGKYTFSRFEGNSEHTIAEGSKAMARQQAGKIATARAVHDAKLVARLRDKHPKIETDLSTVANKLGSSLTYVTVGTVALAGGAPAFVTAVGAAGAAKLTGSILNRVHGNAYFAMERTLAAAAKADQKAMDKAIKDAKADDYLDIIAEKYFEMEFDEHRSEEKRHAKKLGDDYVAAVIAMQQQIDEKTDEEILRDNKYEEPIVVVEVGKGKNKKKKLAGDAEDKIIDNAIIEYAQKSGIMKVEAISIEDKKADITKIIETDLMTRGIIQRDEKVDTIIQDLDKKLKDRQVKISKDEKTENVVEGKMADDAIISVMQEKGITDPSQVSDADVLQKYMGSLGQTTVETMQSSQKSNDVLAKLTEQKTEVEGKASVVDAPKAVDMEAIQASVTTAIQARKSILADKSKQKLDSHASKMMRDALKKKREVELDTKILEKQEELEAVPAPEYGLGDFGGLLPETDGSAPVTDTSSSDDIIKMLQLQTQLHKDKQKVDRVANVLGDRNKRKILYKQMKQTGDTEKFLEQRKQTYSDEHDGSRRVTAGTRKSTEEISTDISEILKRKKQEIRNLGMV